MMQCSKSKGGVDELFTNRQSISQKLDNNYQSKLAQARSQVKSRFNERFKNRCLSALSLYDGNLYTPQLKKAIADSLARSFDLLIMSGGYGLVRPNEVICEYDVNIAETASVWRKYVPGILANYAKLNNISSVDGVFSSSAAYVKVAREAKSFFKLQSIAQFRILTLDYHGEGAQRVVPELQAKLLLELFRGKLPSSIDGIHVRIEE